MDQISLRNQIVLIREDFNVPMKDGKITHTARIESALPTIQFAIAQGAKVILMSHLGRPEEGKFDPVYSLEPIAAYLRERLNQNVALFQLSSPPPVLQPGEVAMLENVRFLPGEEQNDALLSQKLASLCQIFVMDAFAVAHRAQASTCGIAQYAPIACAGPLLLQELEAIEKIVEKPQRPVLAIVGGSKVSTKLNILTHLLDKVDILVVGGGIANTFLAAKGYPMGSSLYEEALIPTARALIEKAQINNKKILLPVDVIVGASFEQTKGEIKLCSEVGAEDKIFDIGPESQKKLAEYIIEAKTVLWNGPVGVFEYPAFAQGTESIVKALAKSQAFSVAGGGDTLAAIAQYQAENTLSYLSTGGGAFLEALEGKILPAVAAVYTHTQEK